MKIKGLSKVAFSSRDGYPDMATPCTCGICGEKKTYGDMRKGHTGGRFIVFASCKTCQNADTRRRASRTEKPFRRIMRQRYMTLKLTALQEEIPFTITLKDLIRCWDESDKMCPILGTILDFQGGRRGADLDRLPSLDKIVPKLGYTPDNIRFISYTANRMKQNITEEQSLRLLAYIRGQL